MSSVCVAEERVKRPHEAVDAASSNAPEKTSSVCNHLEITLGVQCKNLPPEYMLDVKTGAEVLSGDSGHITVGSLFGGGEVAEQCFKSIQNTAFLTLGVPTKYKTEYVAENDEDTQKFLLHNSDAEFLFGDVKDLSDTLVANLRQRGDHVVLPGSDILHFGFICKAKSPSNNSAVNNKKCVMKGDKDTGESFADAMVVVDNQKPTAVVAENVRQMTLNFDDDEVLTKDALLKDIDSDAKYVMSEFSNRGYWTCDFILDAAMLGSKTKRVRWFCLALLENVPGVMATFAEGYINEMILRMHVASQSINDIFVRTVDHTIPPSPQHLNEVGVFCPGVFLFWWWVVGVGGGGHGH